MDCSQPSFAAAQKGTDHWLAGPTVLYGGPSIFS